MSLLCVLTASPRTLADVHLLSRRMLAMRASADALLTMLYLLLHSALSLVFALVSFVLAMLCARENQKAFRL